MNKIDIQQISQTVVDKLQERDQALNGWIGCSAAQTAPVGNYSGIKVLAGDDFIATVTFDTTSPCSLNSVTLTLVPGDYLPTPGLTSCTVSAGSCLLVKAERK